MPSTLKIDWGPRVEPIGMSNTAGWERIKALTRQAESSLAVTFAAAPLSNSHCAYHMSCASQIFSNSRPSLFDVPAYMRRQGNQRVHHDAALFPFSSRFDPTPFLPLPVGIQPAESYKLMSFTGIL
jgi:hypothetical protein